MTADYEIVIGLEIHAELLTDSKVFCGCSTQFGAEPNTQCCPVCLGLPGVLPVLNKKAVDYAIKVGLALNCRISDYSKFDRKNYFYPDLPKAYQISQYDLPIAVGGEVSVPMPDGTEKTVGIVRVHLEEETGKSTHSGESIVTSDHSLIDYNRVGIPLLEMVTQPDIRSPEEARLFLETLRAILLYTGVSDCKMEEGSLRCDANISIRPAGSTELGTKTEIKNMNSFRAVQRALEFEAGRQKRLLLSGERVVQETRHWDDSKGVTVAMRSKEQAHDYRYFPEPDLVPLVIDREWVERIRRELPELPVARRSRFEKEYKIPAYDASLLTSTRAMAGYFERTARLSGDPKSAANWIMGDLSRLLNLDGIAIQESPVSPSMLAEMIGLVNDGTISGKIAKSVFEEMFQTGKAPSQIVEEKGLVQITDEGQLEQTVEKVLSNNPNAVESYKQGKTGVIGFLVGQVMKETGGRANPKLVNELLAGKLSER